VPKSRTLDAEDDDVEEEEEEEEEEEDEGPDLREKMEARDKEQDD